MKVSELQELLSTYHPDDLVILAEDNQLMYGFSPIDRVQDGFYDPENEVRGGFVKNGEQDEGMVPALVLIPKH